MKSAIEQLSSYKSVHLNRKNIRTHFVGVPMIIWSIALLLAGISFEIESLFISELIGGKTLDFTLTGILSLVVLIYYFMLRRFMAIIIENIVL